MNYKFETVKCNICGIDNTQLISTKGKFNLPTNLVLCKNCGLGYLNPRWNAESYIHFYKNEYDKYYRPDFITMDLKKSLNPIIERLKINNLFPKNNKKILDIGSGNGDNLIDFKSIYKESELYAIEPSLEAQKKLEERKINILSDNVENNWDKNFGNSYDLIIMRHVLEHFMNPVNVLNKVRNVLADNGILYLAVPDNLHPTQPLEKSWFRNVHTYYFNKYSLNNIFKLCGFEILNISEGDKFMKGEIYVIAKKSSQKIKPKFSYKHFEIQKEIFQKKLNFEKSFLFFFHTIFRKIKYKFFS